MGGESSSPPTSMTPLQPTAPAELVSDDRHIPCLAHSISLHAAAGKIPADLANVPKQPSLRASDNSLVISDQ